MSRRKEKVVVWMVVARNLWLVSHHQSKRAARWGAVKARIKYSHQLAPFKIVRCEGIVEP